MERALLGFGEPLLRLGAFLLQVPDFFVEAVPLGLLGGGLELGFAFLGVVDLGVEVPQPFLGGRDALRVGRVVARLPTRPGAGARTRR
ncbi:hypothetical protein, partial [Mycobacterium avium]